MTEMKIINLMSQFIQPDDCRHHIKKICQVDGYACATTGRVLIRYKDSYGAIGVAYPNLSDLPLDRTCEADQIVSIDALNKIISDNPCKHCSDDDSKVDYWCCPECEGDGEIEFSNSFHDYECECQTCNGTGVKGSIRKRSECEECDGTNIDPDISFDFLGCDVNPTILNNLIKFPDIKFKYLGKKVFVFNNGVIDGILMGKN